MSILSRTGRVIPGNVYLLLAAHLARELAEAMSFADGGVRVRIAEDVRGATVVIVQPAGPPAGSTSI